ncbi:hypothetical protein ACFQ2B_26485 [Streptomyces stramineus]|uniref:hypothetical protein n=1 Tax=Streptomyces sp. NPDC046215 TaxID=3155774 RepID=UPI0033CDB920
MQPPAGPAPSPLPEGPQPHPHTRPRPAHWALTAALLAAVVTCAALAGPADDTATAAPPPAGATAARTPDAHAARYPLDCGGTGPDIVQQAAADLDGDGRPETTAVVRCRSGGGTRPSGVYVLAAPTADGPPRVLATLVDPAEKMSVTGLGITGGTVSATLLGYSTAKVPRCCPDLRRAVEWRWKGGKFVLTALPVAGSV